MTETKKIDTKPHHHHAAVGVVVATKTKSKIANLMHPHPHRAVQEVVLVATQAQRSPSAVNASVLGIAVMKTRIAIVPHH